MPALVPIQANPPATTLVGDELTEAIQSLMPQSSLAPSHQINSPSPPSAPPPSTGLLEDELSTVIDWQGLGLGLGLEEHKLQEIETDGGGKVADCRRSMFSHWLRSTPTASWQDMVDALGKMGEWTLAARVKFKYSETFPSLQHQGKRFNSVVMLFIQLM